MPKNEPGYVYCAVALLFSAILNAMIFGDIAGLVFSLSKDSAQIQEIYDKSNDVMSEVKISEELRSLVRGFL